MKRCFYLGTCSTCVKILKEWNLSDEFYLHDIKKEAMTAAHVDEMIRLAGSAEAIFSRRSMKYKSMGLKDKKLTEKDYRNLILEEYTFLKRPVLVVDDKIFVGNAKAQVQGAIECLCELE